MLSLTTIEYIFCGRQRPTINYPHKFHKEPERCQEDHQDRGV